MSKLRRLRGEEVKFYASIETEFDRVDGNYMSTEDPEQDKEAEDDIKRRLDAGDPLAWCIIEVQAHWWSPINERHVGTASLGRCSYAPETRLEDIVAENGLEKMAIDQLMAALEEILAAADAIRGALAEE